ncbi:hypothetical protein VSR69_00170 [Paraburkholderia phytofirmans]
MAQARQTRAGRRLKTRREFQQLGVEMVERVARVIQWTPRCVRISRIVQGAPHPPCDVEAARHAQHAERVEPVGVLQRFRFERGRRDGG